MVPYFSIILPIYNVENYLQRCIQSVLDQRFSNYELILVDDGSTDGSADICDRYAGRYSFIQVIHKQNGGLASARNAGAETARGEYIWWVDSDDWIEPDALECLYQASKEKKPEIVKFNYYRVAQKKKLFSSVASPGYYAGKSSVDQLMEQACSMTGRYSLSACVCIYKRDFLAANKLCFVSERIVCSEDYLFNLQALCWAEKIQVIPHALYNYALRDGSLTQTGYKKDLHQRYTILYSQLREYYLNAGKLEQYDASISRMYVWHLMRGTCVPNEYSTAGEHSLNDGRKNIRNILKSDIFADAVKRCNRHAFSPKERIMLWVMEQRLEPVLYWLYVVKPKLKKRLYHEN